MAAVAIHFTIVDVKNKTSKTTVHVPTGFSIAQYAGFAQAMAQIIALISEGVITEVSVSLPINLSGATIRAAALVGADIFKKLFLQARSSVSGLLGKFFIPTYDEANTLANSDQANQADTEVAALISVIENGVNVSGEVVRPVDLRNNNLVDVSIAREVFRKF
jgi:hypothetical protein